MMSNKSSTMRNIKTLKEDKNTNESLFAKILKKNDIFMPFVNKDKGELTNRNIDLRKNLREENRENSEPNLLNSQDNSLPLLHQYGFNRESNEFLEHMNSEKLNVISSRKVLNNPKVLNIKKYSQVNNLKTIDLLEKKNKLMTSLLQKKVHDHFIKTSYQKPIFKSNKLINFSSYSEDNSPNFSKPSNTIRMIMHNNLKKKAFASKFNKVFNFNLKNVILGMQSKMLKNETNLAKQKKILTNITLI